MDTPARTRSVFSVARSDLAAEFLVPAGATSAQVFLSGAAVLSYSLIARGQNCPIQATAAVGVPWNLQIFVTGGFYLNVGIAPLNPSVDVYIIWGYPQTDCQIG